MTPENEQARKQESRPANKNSRNCRKACNYRSRKARTEKEFRLVERKLKKHGN